MLPAERPARAAAARRKRVPVAPVVPGAAILAATVTALNPQARFGADVMSRVQHALMEEGHRVQRDIVRAELERMILRALRHAGISRQRLARVVIVGNTVMHHLVVGYAVAALAEAPFESPQREAVTCAPEAFSGSSR